MNYHSDFTEIFWSVTTLIVWMLVVFCLIMAAPSIDIIMWGK
jgi:hypothetical protein